MWGVLVITLIVTTNVKISAAESSIYYCSDLTPQGQVDIQQLMGMWYAIEIINHQIDAKHEIVYEEGCPILYFSEDRTPTTTTVASYNRNYNYQSNYGSGYGRGYEDRTYGYGSDQDSYLYTTQRTTYGATYNTYGYRGSVYGGVDSNNNNYNQQWRKDHKDDIKRMRLLWDDKGTFVEYTVRYNVSKAGFWISSGPQNGSSLDDKFNEFAGTIQVLKAVGNHMVLVFCHQLPDRRLYSVLLSRVQNLKNQEIHGVHNLLNRRRLSTTSIKKVCTTYNGAGRMEILFGTTFLAFLVTTIWRLVQ